jgi:hypothetical protein
MPLCFVDFDAVNIAVLERTSEGDLLSIGIHQKCALDEAGREDGDEATALIPAQKPAAGNQSATGFITHVN